MFLLLDLQLLLVAVGLIQRFRRMWELVFITRTYLTGDTNRLFFIMQFYLHQKVTNCMLFMHLPFQAIVLLIILISGLCCMIGIDTPTRFETSQES